MHGVTHRLVLDVSSLGYRAFFALGDMMKDPEGRPVGLVHGYLDMVTRLVATRRPDEVIHAYDHDWRPMARTSIYPGYKANRPPEPEGLPEQFALLRQALDLTGMLQVQAVDWEAEDAIGALCAEAEGADLIEMVSGDRDLIQLVRDPVAKLLFTVRGVTELLELDEAGVLDKYGIPAARYAEFAILRGDPSDGLPGVTGVGEKTARALIQAYGSLDELLEDAATDDPREGPLRGKPALRARLVASHDYLDAMRRIVPVSPDAKLEVWGGERDDEALRSFGEANGLRGPVQRLMAALDSAGAD